MVSFKISRVILEILMGGKLGGIDEQTDDEKISPPSALSHEAEMTFVKKTHRGNKSNRPPRPPGLRRKCFHLFDRLDDFHFFQVRVVYMTVE
jgi:hypothetical protein